MKLLSSCWTKSVLHSLSCISLNTHSKSVCCTFHWRGVFSDKASQSERQYLQQKPKQRSRAHQTANVVVTDNKPSFDHLIFFDPRRYRPQTQSADALSLILPPPTAKQGNSHQSLCKQCVWDLLTGDSDGSSYWSAASFPGKYEQTNEEQPVGTNLHVSGIKAARWQQTTNRCNSNSLCRLTVQRGRSTHKRLDFSISELKGSESHIFTDSSCLLHCQWRVRKCKEAQRRRTWTDKLLFHLCGFMLIEKKIAA